MKVVAYFSSWSIYGRNYNVKDIPAKYITHIQYAFVDLKEDGILHLLDPWADVQIGQDWNDPDKTKYWGNFKYLKDLKNQYPHLKIVLSMLGWTKSKWMSPSVETTERRSLLINSIITFLTKYDLFDGIDIDWEYLGPVGGGLETNITNPNDGPNFTLFLQQLRNELNKKYTISIAVSVDPKKLDCYELNKIDSLLDYYVVMAYDYNGIWSDKTGHHSNLYGNKDEFSGDNGIKHMISKGVTPNKIIFGIPTYSRNFANVNLQGSENPIDKPFDGIASGTWEKGVKDYKDLVDNYEGNKLMFDNEKIASYLWNKNTKVLESYDTPETVAKKCEYIKNNKLGGVVFWELSGDHNNNDKSLIQRAFHELNINNNPLPIIEPSTPTEFTETEEETEEEEKCKCKCVLMDIDKEVKSIKFKGKGKYENKKCEFEGEFEIFYK